MSHGSSLIAIVVIGLGLAFVLGTIANRLGISIIVGYLLAGVAVGPFTPGFVADQNVASQLAEIGVILLMFGVGLHFSLQDLLSVRNIVIPGAVVLLPPLAGLLRGDGGPLDAGGLVTALGLTIGKVAAFIALMLLVGHRVSPAILHYIAHTGSRELFRLAVLAVALGVAFVAAELFGVSFALGAFFAGMVLSESELSQRAAEESLPLRDAFAVLFFVSIGMLFNPMVVVTDPGAL